MDTYEKKIREYLNNGEVDELYKNMLLNLFPELKESEDERIRKAIHIYLDWLDGRNKDYQPKGDYSIKDMIAWLEKQGEKKPQRMISAEAKEAMYDKPAWSEEDKDIINHLLAICHGAKKFIQFASCSQEDITRCQNWLTSLKERM